MHHLDAKKTYGEKTWRQLHKNAARNIEQVLETESHKTATYHQSRKLSKLYKLDRRDTAGEVGTNS